MKNGGKLGAIGLALAAFMTATAWGQMPGDINNNCNLDSDDVGQLVNHLLENPELTGGPLVRADANRDTTEDASDAVWIVNHLGQQPVMIPVWGGSFDMGDPWNEGSPDQRPVHTVTLSDYEIGRTEVTNAEYAAFLNSALAANHILVDVTAVYPTSGTGDMLCTTHTGATTCQIEYSGGAFTVRSRGGMSMDNFPVADVTWYGAVVYCNWLSRQQGLQEVYTESGGWEGDLSRNGYHLPTEAQWERAAAWDPAHYDSTAGSHWRYGFRSDTIDTMSANYNLSDPMNFGAAVPNWPLLAPVGHYQGAFCELCCVDMSGNVQEWCHDWFALEYYQSSPATDPEGPSTGTDRVVRGGGWITGEYSLRTHSRLWQTPTTWDSSIGFRLARNP